MNRADMFNLPGFPSGVQKSVSEWPLEIYHPMDCLANGVSKLPSRIFSSLDGYYPASLDSFLCFALIFILYRDFLDSTFTDRWTHTMAFL